MFIFNIALSFNKKNTKGFFLIYAVSFIGVVLLCLSGLWSSLIWHHKLTETRYKRIKIYYLAKSGLSYTQDYAAIMVTQNIQHFDKDTLYDRISIIGTPVLEINPYHVYLVKTQDWFYSIALWNNARVIAMKINLPNDESF